MLSELKTRRKLIGIKQIRKALKDKSVETVFLAANADPALTAPLARQAEQEQIPCVSVPTMKELGAACGIDVGASAAALLK